MVMSLEIMAFENSVVILALLGHDRLYHVARALPWRLAVVDQFSKTVCVR